MHANTVGQSITNPSPSARGELQLKSGIIAHTVPCLGVSVYAGTLDELWKSMDRYQELPESRPNVLISFSSAHGFVEAQRRSDFKKVLERFDVNIPDGKPLAWLGFLKGKYVKQIRSEDFFEDFCSRRYSESKKHFLCGGKEGVVQRVRKTMEKKCVGLQISGHTPPFCSLEDFDYADIARKIEESGSIFVWISLGTPKQEVFAERLSVHLRGKVILTVGALFSTLAGQQGQAPKIFIRTGTEWLFRLFREPKRLLKRYAYVIPMFFFYMIKSLIVSSRT
ncbi:MAG: WecB/TagA/CpsF family glycosyltransferase [Cytophagales bacterium]|nr:WecB/TagA/CpsF family glycosyltransferase [Cytophagales bacterium]